MAEFLAFNRALFREPASQQVSHSNFAYKVSYLQSAC